jgi:ribonucleoside-triphosphate reductase
MKFPPVAVIVEIVDEPPTINCPILALIEDPDEIVPDGKYMDFCAKILQTISALNKRAREEFGILFNSEFPPAENAGHKNSVWDKKDGYVVNRDGYNSYFYPVENENLTIIEKAKMHGEKVVKHLDGGSAAHFNLDDYLDAEQYSKFIDICCELGVNYFCTNVLVTCCEEASCGYIDKRTLKKCSKCDSSNVSHATRIIGYLRKIKNFSAARQKEAVKRYYHKKD